MVGDVTGDAFHETTGLAGQSLRLAQLFGRAGDGEHAVTSLGQAQRESLAQTATAAGDDRDAALLVGHKGASVTASAPRVEDFVDLGHRDRSSHHPSCANDLVPSS